MNKKNLLAGLPMALMLASPMAAAESDYPEPFEPKVLYQDAELIKSYANQPSTAAAAPEAAPETASTPAPAASPAPAPSASEAAAEPVYTQEKSALAENFPILLLAAGLFGALIWVSKRSDRQGYGSSSAFADAPRPAAPITVGFAGETGVSKYLEKLPEPEPVVLTGVAKYLRRLPPPVVVEPLETGVTRYLKKLPKPPVRPTDETGVTKYLKGL